MKLELKDMKHVYPTGDEALKGIDLVIEGNEPVAIIGQNGAGKKGKRGSIKSVVKSI